MTIQVFVFIGQNLVQSIAATEIVLINTILVTFDTRMAYLVRRSPERTEIRESRSTPRGPRSRTLVGFAGALTPEVLARAAARATRPLDAAGLIRRARRLGIPVRSRSSEPEARALLARLRRPDPLDPVIAGVLRRALERAPTAEPREEVADVCEWLGASAAERGAALRELLDTYGRIAALRPARRTRERRRFPRFSSLEAAG